MTINDKLVRAYLDSENMEAYRNEWFFEALEAGKSSFECPTQNAETVKNVQTLLHAIQNAAQDFRPANAAVLDALFPNWQAIPVAVDLIVGCPRPYSGQTVAEKWHGGAENEFFRFSWVCGKDDSVVKKADAQCAPLQRFCA